MLLHGHPFDRTMWEPQLAPLRQAGFRVVAPNLAGYGGRPPLGRVTTMAELAADVLEQLDADRFAPVGLSMGGLVAMELARHDPSRLWAIGLVATTAQPVTDEERAQRLEAARVAETQGMGPIADTMNERLWGPASPPGVQARIDATMRAADPAGAAAAVRGRAERLDYRPTLRELDVPAFVCVGEADSYSTAEVTQELVSCLRRPTVVTLPGVGHLPNLEQPDRFDAELVSFLTQARPRA